MIAFEITDDEIALDDIVRKHDFMACVLKKYGSLQDMYDLQIYDFGLTIALRPEESACAVCGRIMHLYEFCLCEFGIRIGGEDILDRFICQECLNKCSDVA